jgi:reactive chlorine resistance protein C
MTADSFQSHHGEKMAAGPTVLQTVGAGILRYGLVFVLGLWGTAKWTATEAKDIQPLVAHSPFMSWIYRILSIQHGSELIGCVELLLALLILTRRWFPKISAAGSLACTAVFLVTLSFLVTTPELDAGTQGFLIKDIFLLGAAVWTAGEAWQASLRPE